MLIRAKAPLRIGLAGGGTDVSPYSELYGGAILNATIDRYAYATIKPLDKDQIILESLDIGDIEVTDLTHELEINGKLSLLKGVFNHLVKNYGITPKGFHLQTFVDAPVGSGMGSSSTLTVAILGAFIEWYNLPLGEYDIARTAYIIERLDLRMAGGKQDQYAATFGGVNFMEFYDNDKVIVNPLRIKSEYLYEMEMNFLLYYTGTSRLSSKIIESQTKSFKSKSSSPIEAAHKVKEQAIKMKEAILTGNLSAIGNILHLGWEFKKQMAKGISNAVIDDIYETACKAGAQGGKISGAGGGGFMIFFCPENSRFSVMKALEKFGGSYKSFNFVNQGMTSWKLD